MTEVIGERYQSRSEIVLIFQSASDEYFITKTFVAIHCQENLISAFGVIHRIVRISYDWLTNLCTKKCSQNTHFDQKVPWNHFMNVTFNIDHDFKHQKFEKNCIYEMKSDSMNYFRKIDRQSVFWVRIRKIFRNFKRAAKFGISIYPCKGLSTQSCSVRTVWRVFHIRFILVDVLLQSKFMLNYSTIYIQRGVLDYGSRLFSSNQKFC